MDNLYNGFDDLSNELKKYADKLENQENIIEVGVKEFVKDLRKLPKPISQIKKNGYTHLINTFSYKRKNNELEVGWGKYYGPMVENGTVKMNARPHLRPVWERNKEKYYNQISKKIFD